MTLNEIDEIKHKFPFLSVILPNPDPPLFVCCPAYTHNLKDFQSSLFTRDQFNPSVINLPWVQLAKMSSSDTSPASAGSAPARVVIWECPASGRYVGTDLWVVIDYPVTIYFIFYNPQSLDHFVQLLRIL